MHTHIYALLVIHSGQMWRASRRVAYVGYMHEDCSSLAHLPRNIFNVLYLGKKGGSRPIGGLSACACRERLSSLFHEWYFCFFLEIMVCVNRRSWLFFWMCVGGYYTLCPSD